MNTSDPSDRLRECLESSKVAHEFVEKTHTVHTADAAAATGIPLEQITKSLACFGSDGKAYVAIIPGTHKLDFKALASVLGLKSMRMVPFDQAHTVTGYPPGATPPLAYAGITRTVVDETLLAFEWIFGGGGTNELLLRVPVADVIRVNGSAVARISKPPTP
jgi:Cys-tRNA(Pro)/Cys-tRNA(Cys) deacylase